MSKERFDCLYNDCVVRGAWEDGDCIESQIQANKTGLPILAKAKEFFMMFYNADCPKIAIENPVSSKVFCLPAHNQEIQPWQFGHPYMKKTRLWLKGLPNLEPTEVVTENLISWVGGGSKDNKGNKRKQTGTIRDSKTRSKTFQGIAEAMAIQWAGRCDLVEKN